MMFDRIVSNPGILGGKPIVKGTRISVQIILEWFASGANQEVILQKFPQLHAEDLEQALLFAAQYLSDTVETTLPVSSAPVAT